MSILEIVKMIFPLLLLMGLLGIVLWYVKRIGLPKGKGSSSPIGVKVISNHALMPKKHVSVIKVKDKYLVLGLSDTSMVLLKEFDAEQEDEIEIESVAKENFFEILKRNMLPK